MQADDDMPEGQEEQPTGDPDLDADEADGEGEPAATASPAPVRKQTATVAFDKFQQVRNALVGHIRRIEMEDGGVEGQGVKQVDLTNWYIGEIANTQGIADTNELLQELKLVRTIIGHLIRREGTLVVVQEAEPLPELPDVAGAEDTPEQAATKTAKERKRLVDQRVLAVNPNYAFES
jgi:hypothetical protein